MKRENFDLMVKLLVELGYGNIDPELMFCYYIVTNNETEKNKLLQDPGWLDGTYNRDITEREIVVRYGYLVQAPWMEKKFNEIYAQKEMGR